jgi:hypothetical protein
MDLCFGKSLAATKTFKYVCIKLKSHNYRVFTLCIFSVITVGYLLPLVLHL